MFVDTSALREQVIYDVIASFAGSAGQRCSALRVLYVSIDSADALITALSGALAALVIGDPADPATDIGPVIAEIPEPDYLEREVFGPILHSYCYDPAQSESVARRLADRGYGLTRGVDSRIDGFAARVRQLVPAGNVYVTRSMTGAVVGVQPFGGEGLSGTGPKAGGPHALLRYAVERALSVNIAAQGGDPALLNL